MVTKVSAWADKRGALHSCEREALLVDIEVALDVNGATTPGLARMIADAAHDLTPLLQQVMRISPQPEEPDPINF